MEKISESENQENDIYTSLKRDLFEGTISFESLRQKLLELDQSTPDRDASDENLEFLLDPQIVELVMKQDQETVQGYYGFLSLTQFHVAQRLAFKNGSNAIDFFRKSLVSAQKSHEHIYDEWISYIQGTILYLESKEIPIDLIEKVEQSRNAQILRNYNKSLQQRGSPSYAEDYAIL